MYYDIGIIDFNFNAMEVLSGERGKYTCINLLKLLIHLWPGDWGKQLAEMNCRIQIHNAKI